MQQYKDKLKDGTYKCCFFAIDTKGQYHEVMEYIYDLALSYEKSGAEVYIVYQENDFKKPEWLSKQHAELTHYSLSEFSGNVSISPSDFIFVPEMYAKLCEQFIAHKVPAEFVAIVQRPESVFDALEIGQNYNVDFNIKHVVCPSESIKHHLAQYMPALQFHVVTPYIKEAFCEPKMPKQPLVSLVSGTNQDFEAIVKKFYLKYPQYGWIPFKIMNHSNINDMAEQMKSSACTVFLDAFSAFPVQVLQSLACKAFPIALTPKLAPDFMVNDGKLEEIGAFTVNEMKIVDLIAIQIDAFVTDSTDESILSLGAQKASQFTESSFTEQIMAMKTELEQSRTELFNKIIEKQENEQK